MSRWNILAVVVASLFTIQAAMADQVTVPLLGSAPVIDGKINPAEWAQAARIDGALGGDDKLDRRSIRRSLPITVHGNKLSTVLREYSPQ